MNQKLVNYRENIFDDKVGWLNIFSNQISPISIHYPKICKILKNTLGENLHSWEGKHEILLEIADQVGRQTKKNWLGKVVAELLIDQNFTLADLKKALKILDQISLSLTSKRRFWDFGSQSTIAQNLYRFLKNNNSQAQKSDRSTPSLTYLDMLNDWQQKNKITDCFQLHRLLATVLEMQEIPTNALHLLISYNGKKQWHEQTVFYPDSYSEIFDLSLGENYRQNLGYQEFLVEHFNFAELLEYRISQYYFNKYYNYDPLRGIELINRLDLLYNKKSNLNFLYIRNAFYEKILDSIQFQKQLSEILLFQACQNAKLIWHSFKNYPDFIPEDDHYLNLLKTFRKHIECYSLVNRYFFSTFAREIKSESKKRQKTFSAGNYRQKKYRKFFVR